MIKLLMPVLTVKKPLIHRLTAGGQRQWNCNERRHPKDLHHSAEGYGDEPPTRLWKGSLADAENNRLGVGNQQRHTKAAQRDVNIEFSEKAGELMASAKAPTQ